MDAETVVTARSATLKMLEQPLAEPLPMPLSKAALKAAQGAKNPKDKMNAQWYGLNAITECKESDPTGATLANLGKSLSTNSTAQGSVIIARDCIMKTLINSEPRAAGHAIAGAVLDALGGITDPKDMNNLLWYSFDAIKKAPGATEEQRGLATRGMSVRGAEIKAAVQARKQTMEEIAFCADPLQEVRNMAENLAKSGEPSAVEVQDDFVTIDGLKLEIKKEADDA